MVRAIIGIQPNKTPSEQSCLHANVSTEHAVKLGLVDYSQHNALEYWGGQEGKWDKIVLSPCNGGKLLSYYCFFSRDKGDYSSHTWGGEDLPVEQLLEPYPELDSQVLNHLKIGEEIRPWRLWVQYVFPPLSGLPWPTLIQLLQQALPLYPQECRLPLGRRWTSGTVSFFFLVKFQYMRVD